ncbi:hypothetical protein [Streptomyces sp. NPDC046371]|uniref:hypothetical protein n=1 Tax=Streptomyces sp. NPDC046371 TaxID=3154916 RepID=UPI0033F61EFD
MTEQEQPPTHCWACTHPVEAHDLQPDGTRPCRSIGHHEGIPCADCRALLTPQYRAAVQEERENGSFNAAWGAYMVTFQDARNAYGEGAPAFFTDIHQSALASALIAYRKDIDNAGGM